MSTDDGVTWTEQSAGLGNLSLRGLAVDSSSGAVYVGSAASGVFVLE